MRGFCQPGGSFPFVHFCGDSHSYCPDILTYLYVLDLFSVADEKAACQDFTCLFEVKWEKMRSSHSTSVAALSGKVACIFSDGSIELEDDGINVFEKKLAPPPAAEPTSLISA